MGDTELYTGVCDLCGKEADAAVEDCMNIVCMKSCNREGGDIYHQDCIKKYISTASKGSTGRQPKIPFSNFGCPKGKSNKTVAPEPCKGNVLHCKRIHFKDENKAAAPPPVQVVNPPPPERRKKEKKPKTTDNNGGAGFSKAAAANAGMADTGWETVGPKKLPKLPAKPPSKPSAQFRPTPAAKLPPIPQAPKPDPLGRNLNKDKPQKLPVGFVPDDDIAKAAAGKSAKKNQKRAAKRKETTGSTSMGEPSSTNLSGWGEGFGSGAGSEAGGSEHNPLMGNTKFITDIDAFNKLLAGQLSDSGSEDEYEDEDALAITTEEEHEEGPDFTPDFTLREGVEWPVVVARESEDDGNGDGWQSVLPGGRVSAPTALRATNRPSSTTPSAAASGAISDDDEQLRAALEASAAAAALADTATNTAAAAAAPDDDYEQQLIRALAESQRAEEQRLQREKSAQAALLAQYEQGQQQQQYRQQYDSTAWQAGRGVSATPILSYSQAPQSAAASTVTWQPAGTAAPAPAAAQPISFLQYTNPSVPQLLPQQQQQPLYFQQPQSAVSIQLPSPAAPAAATNPLFLRQQQQQAPVPAAPLPFLQQQQASPLLWQQRYAGTEAPAAAFAAAAPAGPKMMAAAATVVDDDDDTDELLALLTVA